MPEQPDEHDLPLPCASCDYDLRGQADLHCPECGRNFSSIEELRALALDVRRVFNRVLIWRIKFAVAYALAFIWLLVGLVLINFAGVGSIGATIGWLVTLLPLAIMPLIAFVFLIQVMRLRSNQDIGRKQRRELNGTIPLLIIYMAPGFIFLPWVAYIVRTGQATFGSGV